MTDRTTTHDPTQSRPGSRDYSSPSSATGGADENFSESERARQAAEEIKTAAKDAAASTATALRNRLSGELDYRKYRSRQRLMRVAEALRQTGTGVNGEDEVIGRYLDRAATRVERAAAYLEQNDVNQIMRDARGLARRRPEVFAGGLFVAGLVLGRFLRSSATADENYQEAWDDYPSYAGASTSGSYPSSIGGSSGGTANPYAGTKGSDPSTSPTGDGRMP